MGSLFKRSAPTPPPPPPPAGYRDEIGGTEQVPVKNANGTTTYVTRRLPLTEAEKAEKEAFDKLMKNALTEIESLSASDYKLDENTQKTLNAWTAEREKLIAENFDTRELEEEKRLARRGLSSSSAANAARRQRNLDEQSQFKTLENEKDLLKDDIRNNNLAYQQNLYNIASQRKDLDHAKSLQSASTGISAVNSANSFNRASIMDYYNRQSAQAASSFGIVDTASAIGSVAGSLDGVSSTGFGSLFKGMF